MPRRCACRQHLILSHRQPALVEAVVVDARRVCGPCHTHEAILTRPGVAGGAVRRLGRVARATRVPDTQQWVAQTT
eukprot:3788039-Prymnesium_polylepis.1